METKEMNIIQELLNLPILSQLVDIIQVNDKYGEILIDNISKDNNNNIKSISDIIEFKLKTHRLTIKNSLSSTLIISDLPSSKTISNENIVDRFCSDITKCFISDISLFRNAKRFKFKYFNQGIIKKIVNRNTKKDLLKCILDISKSSSWIIISNSILNLIKDLELFEYEEKEKNSSLIYKCGKLLNINVYLNKDEVNSIIYFGNSKSVTGIINKNIKEETIKYKSSLKTGKSVSIDYLFMETGEISILKVE